MNTDIQHHACVVQKSGHYLRRGNTTQASGPTSPPPTTNRPTTTTTKQTTQKPSDDPIEQYMQNELLWCGYSGLDIQACVSRVQGNLEYYFSGTFSCAGTKSVDSYASWHTYQAIDTRYGYNIVCGPGSNTKVNRNELEYACSWAAYDCYYKSNKMSCIRDHAYLKKNQKFCSTSRYNLLVSPQTHSVAYHGYGPHIADGQDIAYCTAYCIGN